jgi:hypothetical protein
MVGERTEKRPTGDLLVEPDPDPLDETEFRS